MPESLRELGTEPRLGAEKRVSRLSGDGRQKLLFFQARRQKNPFSSRKRCKLCPNEPVQEIGSAQLVRDVGIPPAQQLFLSQACDSQLQEQQRIKNGLFHEATSFLDRHLPTAAENVL